MPGFRKEAEALCLSVIDELVDGGKNTQLYRNKFESMSDEQFDKFIDDLENERQRLVIIVPNFSENALDLERTFDIGERLGHQFFQQIWIPPRNGMPGYWTPIEYLVVHLPLCRQAQLLEKKISIPEDNNTVDDLTGQPTGSSKGSKISYPEVQMLAARGLDDCLEELITFRGGDEKGFAAMNASILRTGAVDLKAIRPYRSGVKSLKALKAFLAGMHLKSTL